MTESKGIYVELCRPKEGKDYAETIGIFPIESDAPIQSFARRMEGAKNFPQMHTYCHIKVYYNGIAEIFGRIVKTEYGEYLYRGEEGGWMHHNGTKYTGILLQSPFEFKLESEEKKELANALRETGLDNITGLGEDDVLNPHIKKTLEHFVQKNLHKYIH